MYEWFDRSADAHPQLLALSVGDVDLTYSALAQASGAARAAIVGDSAGRRGGRPRRIGILASRSAATYIAYLAVLRAGATVVPLNVEHPVARSAQIIRLAELDALAFAESEAELAAALRAETGVALVSMTGNGSDFTDGSRTASAPPAAPHPDDFAYIVFTSGSTGTPKGVPIRHRNIASWLPYIVEHFTDGPGARVAQTSELSWDLSVFNMFLAWGSGGAVVVPSRTDMLTPPRHIAEHGITHWHSTPSSITMSRLLGELSPGVMPTLRWSMFCGEPLTVDHIRAWQEAAPNSRIANVYGQTEITVSSAVYDLPASPSEWPGEPTTSLPIGRPHPSIEWAVVGENGQAADEGELLLRGPQRFDGYLDPKQPRGPFVLWSGDGLGPFGEAEELTPAHWYRTGDRIALRDGQLFYLGRLDNQVKVRGHRVELGDIETSLRGHPGLDEVVVVPYEAQAGIFDLAGVYSGAHVSEDELSEFLADRLPSYMVPRLFLRLERLPLNLNGKVDRRRLTEQVTALIDP
ncbi:AMP-binding protein [Nonomuraea sp. NPDC003727]